MESEEPITAEDANLTQSESKKKRLCDFVKSYFPIKEESWNYAIPMFGMILSCISVAMFFSFIYPVSCQAQGLLDFAYFVIAAGFSIELYFSLKQKKSKQHYAIWLLMKTIEVFLLGMAVMNAFLRATFHPYFSDTNNLFWELVILNLLVLRYVIKRSSKAPEEPTMESGNRIANMTEYSKVGIY